MRTRLTALLLLLLVLLPLSALDFGFEARTGDIRFPWGSDSATSGTVPWDPGLATTWFWGGAGWVDIPLGEDFDLHLGYETDPVLRNIASSLFRFERGVAQVGVGPFLGFLNQDGRLVSAGLSTSILVQWPGLAFVSARSDGGLALGLVAGLSSVPQVRAELSAGFYTPNAIVSAVLDGRRFSQTDSAQKAITDDLTRYLLVVNIYKKNVPYQITTTLGYEQRSKYFESSGLTDTLGAAVAGLRLSVEAFSGFKVYGEFKNSVFTFGMGNLTGRSPLPAELMFSAVLGLTWSLDPASLADIQRQREERSKAEAAATAPPVEGPPAAPATASPTP